MNIFLWIRFVDLFNHFHCIKRKKYLSRKYFVLYSHESTKVENVGVDVTLITNKVCQTIDPNAAIFSQNAYEENRSN